MRRKRRIFVVDDDAPARESTAVLLALFGWDVRAFACADDLLEAIDLDPPACIVSDLDMPGTDGASMIESLRRSGNRVPVVVMTGFGSRQNLAARAQAAGARTILSKPFRDIDLQGAVERAVAQVD